MFILANLLSREPENRHRWNVCRLRIPVRSAMDSAELTWPTKSPSNLDNLRDKHNVISGIFRPILSRHHPLYSAGEKIKLVYSRWDMRCQGEQDMFRLIITLHSCKLMTSKLGQNRARHFSARSVSCRQPLLKKLRSSGHPRANASTPLSVSNSHQDRLMCVRSGQPSEISLSAKSVISGHESKFSRCNFGQWLLRAAHVASEIFLHWLRLSSSIFGHDCARVRIEMLPILWHPRSDNWRRKPPQRLEIFSITGPWNYFHWILKILTIIL